MSFILIAIKEGVTLFANGTLFQINDTIITKNDEHGTRKYFQIPDDGMGRPTTVETKDVVICEDADLHNAEPGHGRCTFSKDEIRSTGKETYKADFSVRSISFKQHDKEWHMIWRLPKNDQLIKSALFINKVTKEKTTIQAENSTLEYEEFSISSVDYEQTIRKHKALHGLWKLNSLPPGFYETQIDIGNGSTGIVHFIKHYPVQLPYKDGRKTDEVCEIAFSPELWNVALAIKLAWGPESRIPFQVRLLDLHPTVKWAEANFLEKICNETSSTVWNIYEREAQGLITLQQAMDEVVRIFPWIDEAGQSRLRSQGEYYSKLKG